MLFSPGALLLIRDRAWKGADGVWRFGSWVDLAARTPLTTNARRHRLRLTPTLQTENIFLTRDNTVRLGDFGLGKTLMSSFDMATTTAGASTPAALSPSA